MLMLDDVVGVMWLCERQGFGDGKTGRIIKAICQSSLGVGGVIPSFCMKQDTRGGGINVERARFISSHLRGYTRKPPKAKGKRKKEKGG